MAWTPLSSRLSGLPLVLSGPIVRKTTPTSVSVWIALQTAQSSLQLIIKTKDLVVLGSTSTSTKAIGKNLHIAVVTVKNLSLKSDVIYLYDMLFDGSKSFSSPGILKYGASGIDLICYPPYTLPSFLLPASKPENLIVTHGSCRKIHGGQRNDGSPQSPQYYLSVEHENLDIDALSILHDLINQNPNDPLKRPQQLFLTGDQIYADDVSDMMLYMIQADQSALFDINEQMAQIGNPNDLGPLTRYKAINETAEMTADSYAKSHLMSLTEFYMMYLYVWSDTIWTDLPDTEILRKYVEKTNWTYHKDHFYTFRYDIEEYQRSQSIVLNNFRSFLPKIRKLLANIPTYMIFDDHEITDDWFLSSEWCDKVLDNPVGSRIIQNGLSAYAVFQAWGNTPEKFVDRSTKEAQLLNKLVQLSSEKGAKAPTWDEIGTLVLPTIVNGSSQSEPKFLLGGIDWYYYLDFSYYQVIVLNCRTMRGFNQNHYPRLLSSAAMDKQILQGSIDPKYKFTIVIAPAPVIGHTILEQIQNIAKGTGSLKSVAEYDFEPWSADPETLTQFLKKLTRYRKVIFLSGDVHYAYSAKVNYQMYPDMTNQFDSTFLQFTASSLKNSEKKTTDKTLSGSPILGVPAISGESTSILDLNTYSMIGWETSGVKGVIKVGADDGTKNGRYTEEHDFNVNSLIDIENINYGASTKITVPADRKYTVTFLKDNRNANERGAIVLKSTVKSDDYSILAQAHHYYAPYSQMTKAVGFNNLGYLTFKVIGSQITAKHLFWYKPEIYETIEHSALSLSYELLSDDPELYKIGAYTIHEAIL